MCFPFDHCSSPNSYFPCGVTLVACTVTLNVFFSPIFLNFKELGTTTILYPGNWAFAVYVLRGPTLVTVRVTVTAFNPRFGNVIEG